MKCVVRFGAGILHRSVELVIVVLLFGFSLNKVYFLTNVFAFEVLASGRWDLTARVQIFAGFEILHQSVVAFLGGFSIDIRLNGVVLVLVLLQFLDVYHSLDGE